MNAIDKAIQDVMFGIPPEILHYVFISRNFRDTYYPVSLEHMIRSSVIEPRVIVDCNLVGGVHAEIDASNLRPVFDDGVKKVYRVPKDMTEGRSIVSVQSVGFDRMGLQEGLREQPTGVVAQSRRVFEASKTDVPNASTRVSVIGENTIMLDDHGTNSYIGRLRVILANDENMGNLDPKTYPHFSKLCELAVKAYIYTNTRIGMDKARLSGGMELGAFKDAVDEFADSNTLYQEYLRDTWTKVAIMDDRPYYNRILSSQVN